MTDVNSSSYFFFFFYIDFALVFYYLGVVYVSAIIGVYIFKT